jgi:outer membrane receptor protein involved in Fe transport
VRGAARAGPVAIVAGIRSEVWHPRALDGSSRTATLVSPRVTLEHTRGAWAVDASAYHSARAPTLNELYRGFRAGSVITQPNAALDPERLSGADLGARWSANAASVRIAAFWNRLDGAVTNVSVSSSPGAIVRRRENAGRVNATGLELEARVGLPARLTARASGAITTSRFGDAPAVPALAGLRVPQVPTHAFAVALERDGGARGWSGALEVRGSGFQYEDDLNTLVLRPYATVDASLGWAPVAGLGLGVAGENLLDQDYDVGRTPDRMSGSPRTVRLTVRWTPGGLR